MLDHEQLWKLTLDALQLQMTHATFDTWVKDTHLVSQTDQKLTISANSEFAQDWLENRLYNTINRVISGILGHPVELEFVVSPATNDNEAAGSSPLIEEEAISTPSPDDYFYQAASSCSAFHMKRQEMRTRYRTR